MPFWLIVTHFFSVWSRGKVREAPCTGSLKDSTRYYIYIYMFQVAAGVRDGNVAVVGRLYIDPTRRCLTVVPARRTVQLQAMTAPSPPVCSHAGSLVRSSLKGVDSDTDGSAVMRTSGKVRISK